MARMFRKDGGVDRRQSEKNKRNSVFEQIGYIAFGILLIYLAITVDEWSLSWRAIVFLLGAGAIYLYAKGFLNNK